MRRFEEVSQPFRKFPEVETKLPIRSNAHSAGYDFYSKEKYRLVPGESHVFWTDVKAYMFYDNVLQIYTRSGNGVKYGIVLKNGTGIIDADYAGNESNDGNIGICLTNTGSEDFKVEIGDRIAQGIFTRYLIVDNDRFLTKESENVPARSGGFGSSGK